MAMNNADCSWQMMEKLEVVATRWKQSGIDHWRARVKQFASGPFCDKRYQTNEKLLYVGSQGLNEKFN